jgi:hypothetical protein
MSLLLINDIFLLVKESFLKILILASGFRTEVSYLKKSFPHPSLICFLSFQTKEEMDKLSEIVEGH